MIRSFQLLVILLSSILLSAGAAQPAARAAGPASRRWERLPDVAGGEYSPGLRTLAVHQMTVALSAEEGPPGRKGGVR